LRNTDLDSIYKGVSLFIEDAVLQVSIGVKTVTCQDLLATDLLEFLLERQGGLLYCPDDRAVGQDDTVLEAEKLSPFLPPYIITEVSARHILIFFSVP
jgi:hypothetical protein